MTPAIRKIDAIDPILDFIRNEDVDRSIDCWLLTFDDEPATVLGVVPETLLSDKAYVWSYSWPIVRQYRKTFLKVSKEFVAMLLGKYPFLYGISKHDTVWLEHLGATFGADWRGFATFVIR